jgi:hypothetical protein
MTTRLEKELRREVDIGGKPYTVTLSPDGIKLTEKGRRKGHELRWQDWVSGEAALAVALNASLSESAAPASTPATPPSPEVARAEPPQAEPSKAGRPARSRPSKKKRT